MTLFEECLKALGPNKEILSYDETAMVFKSFIGNFHISKWGVVDWEAVDNRFTVGKVDDISYVIETYRPSATWQVCILWNDSSLPCVKVDLNESLRVVDDITAVSFDTWLYNDKDLYVIEFHHEGRITIGFI